MSRSPLHCSLIQLFEKNAGLLDTRRCLSRRQFLQWSGLIGLAGCSIERRPRRTVAATNVVIVGAGLGGLSCAYALKKAGISAKVYEASSRIGGRQFTGRGLYQNEQFVELGGEFIDSNHSSIRTLAHELGLELQDLKATPNESEELFIVDGRATTGEYLSQAFYPLALEMVRDLEKAKVDPAYLHRLDHISLGEWLDRRKDCDAGLKKLIAQAYMGEYGLPVEEQSCLNLLWLIDSKQVNPFRLFGNSDERYRIRGGNDRLSLALADQIAENLQMDRKLVDLREASSTEYQLTFSGSSGTEELRASHVVLAIPFTTLRQISLAVFSKEKRQIIENLGYGTNSKLFLEFQNKPWHLLNRSGTVITTGPLQSCWDTSRGQSGPHGLLTIFKGGPEGLRLADGEVSSQAVTALKQVEEIFPGSSNYFVPHSAHRFIWPRYAHALGSYSCSKPGQATLIGTIGSPQGHIYFCGEHCSTDFQGYMEGAVETGLNTASHLVSTLAAPL